MRKRQKIRIKFVVDPDDLSDVFRFRYAIYIEEMNRIQKHADHERKSIFDPLDQGCYLMAAYDGTELIGTVRLNFSSNSELGYYEKFYRMDMAGASHPVRTSICTRLMIAPKYRKSMLGPRLATSCFEFCLTAGIAWNFMDCNDHLVEFFAGLGFRTYMGKAHHEEYGSVNPMRFDLRDWRHLQSIRSPFLRSIQDYGLALSSSAAFNSLGFGSYLNPPQVDLKPYLISPQFGRDEIEMRSLEAVTGNFRRASIAPCEGPCAANS